MFSIFYFTSVEFSLFTHIRSLGVNKSETEVSDTIGQEQPVQPQAEEQPVLKWKRDMVFLKHLKRNNRLRRIIGLTIVCHLRLIEIVLIQSLVWVSLPNLLLQVQSLRSGNGYIKSLSWGWRKECEFTYIDWKFLFFLLLELVGRMNSGNDLLSIYDFWLPLINKWRNWNEVVVKHQVSHSCE